MMPEYGGKQHLRHDTIDRISIYDIRYYQQFRDTILSHTNLKLDRHPVDRHALGYKLHPHRALEILAEFVVVEPSD